MLKYYSYLLKVMPLALLLLTFQNCSEDSLNEDLSTPVAEEQLTDVQAINFDAGIEKEDLAEDEIQLRTNSYYTFHTLNQALSCTGLGSALFQGNKTIYAPSDAAFKKLGLNARNVCEELDRETLTEILLYHVTEGRVSTRERGCLKMLNGDISQIAVRNHRLFINDSRIYYVFGQRGRHYRLRVYIIDEVLMPPTATIAEAAAGTEKFEVLFQAVLAADPGIAEALSDPDQVFTVFAPTNEAFVDLLGALNVSSLEELVDAIGVEGLSTVLLYHVVDGCAFSNDLRDGQRIPTLQGESIKVDLDNFELIDATDDPSGLVLDCLDILTANGVVHTIDKVLLPEEIVSGL